MPVIPTDDAWELVVDSVKRTRRLPAIHEGFKNQPPPLQPPYHGFVRVTGARQPSGHYRGIVTCHVGEHLDHFEDRIDVPVWIRTPNFTVLTRGTAGLHTGQGVYWGRCQDVVKVYDHYAPLETGTASASGSIPLVSLAEYIVDDTPHAGPAPETGTATSTSTSSGTGTGTTAPSNEVTFTQEIWRCEGGLSNIYKQDVTIGITGGLLTKHVSGETYLRTEGRCLPCGEDSFWVEEILCEEAGSSTSSASHGGGGPIKGNPLYVEIFDIDGKLIGTVVLDYIPLDDWWIGTSTEQPYADDYWIITGLLAYIDGLYTLKLCINKAPFGTSTGSGTCDINNPSFIITESNLAVISDVPLDLTFGIIEGDQGAPFTIVGTVQEKDGQHVFSCCPNHVVPNNLVMTLSGGAGCCGITEFAIKYDGTNPNGAGWYSETYSCGGNTGSLKFHCQGNGKFRVREYCNAAFTDSNEEFATDCKTFLWQAIIAPSLTCCTMTTITVKRA